MHTHAWSKHKSRESSRFNHRGLPAAVFFPTDYIIRGIVTRAFTRPGIRIQLHSGDESILLILSYSRLCVFECTYKYLQFIKLQSLDY